MCAVTHQIVEILLSSLFVKSSHLHLYSAFYKTDPSSFTVINCFGCTAALEESHYLG